MARLRRDRPALVFLALIVLGLLLLAGVLLAVLLPGKKHAAPATTSTTTPATTSTTAPVTTTAPITTAPAPPGPLRAVSVGPLSATVEWVGHEAPARVAYGLPDLGPTMWAPVQGGRATLTGLRYGTAYRVWAGDATLDVTTAGAPDSPVAATGGGAILLDGQPYFPLLVLAQCPSGYGASLAAGITLYAENACGGIAEQTAALGGRALSLTKADEAGIGGQGVIGWYFPDEPDLKEITGDTLPQFPTQAATGRLSVLTLSNHFYSRTQALPAGRGVYPGLVARADVVGFDLYPLQEFCSTDWLPDVAAAQRELVALAGGRPTFQWIESSTWHCHRPSLRVTPTTIRAESWLAVAGGARGLGYFPADWPAESTPGISTVAREVAALGAGLLAPDAPVSARPPVVAAGRAANGALYVIAVNPTERLVRGAIDAPGLAGRTATVVGEGRTVAAVGDRLEDTFASARGAPLRGRAGVTLIKSFLTRFCSTGGRAADSRPCSRSSPPRRARLRRRGRRRTSEQTTYAFRESGQAPSPRPRAGQAPSGFTGGSTTASDGEVVGVYVEDPLLTEDPNAQSSAGRTCSPGCFTARRSPR